MSRVPTPPYSPIARSATYNIVVMPKSGDQRFARHSDSWIFIPYVAMIPCGLAIMAITGIFFMPPLALQLIVA
ncbi:hypothetical protein SAMN05216270_10514 [Glycomyces harbinensis]|uniref:Uncharacterized protein n=1 Tax=Glycomyces harbinensis TaxID=58114 RepID=A0A1G6VNP7_9ACTN|nr:hypothetical protein SAMN05216270_10514 [Glycomyces harbinensis]